MKLKFFLFISIAILLMLDSQNTTVAGIENVFGGIYQVDSRGDNPEYDNIVNSFTGALSCLSGYTSVQATNFWAPDNGASLTATQYYCIQNSAATGSSFGGIYQLLDDDGTVVNGNSECGGGGCCPSGTNSYQFQSVLATATEITSSSYICLNASFVLGESQIGGFYQKPDSGSPIDSISNPFTQGESCPLGYTSMQIGRIFTTVQKIGGRSYICVSCATLCVGANPNQYYTCNSGSFLYNNQCINPCPASYWGDFSTNTCQPCSSSGSGPYYTCATCPSGGTDNNCTSCNSGQFLYPSTEGECLDSCPPGYWEDTSTNTCQACYRNSSGPYYSCATCSVGGANNNCDSCNLGSFLYSSQCLSACPDRYWPDYTTNTCQLCSSDSVNISSCPNKVQSNIVTALQVSAKSSSTALVAISAALQNSNSASGISSINLLLYLAAVEAIANMQYLNINHSQIALNAYSGLSFSIIPNWISNFNTLNQTVLVFNYGIFEKNQTSSLYLDNYGDSLTETLIYPGVCLILVPITFFRTPDKLLSSPLGKAYAIVFGTFFSNVFGQIQSQILFSALQILKTDLLIDTYSRVSYAMAWLTMYAVFWLQIICFCRLKAIFSLKQRDKKMVDVNSEEIPNQNQLTASTIKLRWSEKKYEMVFNSYKDDNKMRFFFTYWVILFDTIYIILILCLQYEPGLQCLSIVLLTIYLIVFSVILRPMKEKSAAILFIFNYASVLLIAIVNLGLAVREVSSSKPTNNDDFGWAIFIVISINSSVNILFAIAGVLSRIYALYQKWKNGKKKSNTESNKNVYLAKSISPKEGTLGTNCDKSALNLIEEKVNTLENPKEVIVDKRVKIIRKKGTKQERSLESTEKRIHIPEQE